MRRPLLLRRSIEKGSSSSGAGRQGRKRKLSAPFSRVGEHDEMQADTQVVLGQVAFRGFEVPENIPFGGKHIINRHTLIGGARVLDRMGYSPDDIRWSGRFRGNDALQRAKAVEAMVRSGEEVTLSWGALTYQVVVEDFDPVYEKRYEIPYKIRVTVSDVQNQGQSGSSLGAAISADMGILAGHAGNIPDAPP